jgi:hypothetical protein
MSNSSGKGMRIGAKIELGYNDDFFKGCEMASELLAVIVVGLGHDDEAVAPRIGLLGRGGRSGLGENAHIPPPPGCVW